jgi:hypothetical protein
MNKSKLKNFVKRCIAEVIVEGNYDPLGESDIPLEMSMQMLCMKISKAETARKIPHKDLSKMDYGQLQQYYNQVEKFDDTVYVPGVGWGGIKEAGEQKPERVSNSERNQLGKAFAKLGLDGNGRFVKKEYGLGAVTSALNSLGFQLDMVTLDTIMGDKGSRNFTYRRKNDEGQDPFTEKPEIINSRIVFTWELLAPDKFEILAYAS